MRRWMAGGLLVAMMVGCSASDDPEPSNWATMANRGPVPAEATSTTTTEAGGTSTSTTSTSSSTTTLVEIPENHWVQVATALGDSLVTYREPGANPGGSFWLPAPAMAHGWFGCLTIQTPTGLRFLCRSSQTEPPGGWPAPAWNSLPMRHE